MALELNGTTGVSLVQDGVVTAADLASGAITSAALPAGSVLQVVQVTKTAGQTLSLNPANLGTISEFTGTITPSSTSSKILVTVVLNISKGNTQGSFAILNRDGSYIPDAAGDASGSKRSVSSFGGADLTDSRSGNNQVINYLDSPDTTNEISYTISVGHNGTSARNIYINRQAIDDNNAYNVRAICTMTLMEIAG